MALAKAFQMDGVVPVMAQTLIRGRAIHLADRREDLFIHSVVRSRFRRKGDGFAVGAGLRAVRLRRPGVAVAAQFMR